MGICGKIFDNFMINSYSLQMLWIKYKFSECPAPCTIIKPINWRFSGDGSAEIVSASELNKWWKNKKSRNFLWRPFSLGMSYDFEFF